MAVLLLAGAGASAQRQRPYLPPAPGSDPWVYGNGQNTWNQSWNSRPYPKRGACFFTTAGYSGNRFCVRIGDRLDRLPGNFGDNLSSIQIFGGTRVRIYNDRNFSGGSVTLNRSVSDLRRIPFRGGHTWNNRVSSVAVY